MEAIKDGRELGFGEVARGYTPEEAIEEAKRCLNCKNKPCVGNCPVHVDIPAFIQQIVAGNFEEAYQIISKANALPAVSGRVCPQELQCEQKCIRGIKSTPVRIGKLERFAADYHNEHVKEKPQRVPSNGHKVAIVGSGPAGLSCAGQLAAKGYEVTIFEALHLAGGVLVYGIPEFRLPKSVVQHEIDTLTALGVKVETNVVIGKTISIDELTKEHGFEAVFIGSGAGLPKFMNVPGEDYNGVFSANEFLTRINLMKAYKENPTTPIHHGVKVAVFGGGNVAMDAARCARRLGAEVSIVYRRTDAELPARREEVEHAKLEGIKFEFLTAPLEVIGNEKGWVTGVKCQRMKLSEPDASGRARPVPIEGSEFVIEADCVIPAIGTSPNPLIKSTTEGLATQTWGGIIVDEDGLTSREGIYAGGDAVSGAATVILAMGAGKTAAAAIDKYITEKAAK